MKGGEEMELREIYHNKRRQLGIHLSEIAKSIEVSIATISRHETGKIIMRKAQEYMDYIDKMESK
jgi:predicted transcriptional regulator